MSMGSGHRQAGRALTSKQIDCGLGLAAGRTGGVTCPSREWRSVPSFSLPYASLSLFYLLPFGSSEHSVASTLFF